MQDNSKKGWSEYIFNSNLHDTMYTDILKNLSGTLSGIYNVNNVNDANDVDHINLSAVINNVNNVNNECSSIRNIYFKCLATNDVDHCNKIFYSFLNICEKHNTLNFIARQRYI
tara:strand:- start:220 stop:561 length:342 start_codon:yes stop_codon:yes gene_type:complete